MDIINDREIVRDINKIKDIRREILNINFDDKIDDDKEAIKLLKMGTKLIKGLMIGSDIVLVILGLFPIAVVTTIVFSLVSVLYDKVKEIVELKLETDIKLREKSVINIDELIDNYEMILENRKGKDIDKTKIKNLNICFCLDERYNCALKQINDKYKYVVSEDIINNDNYVSIEDYCKDIKLSVHDITSDMIPKSKVRIKSLYKE